MGYISIIFSAIFAGITLPVLKSLVTTYSPIPLLLLRFSISLVIFLVLFFRKGLIPRNKKHLILTMLVASPVSLSICLITYGLKSTSVVTTQSILLTLPVYTTIASYFFLKEKIVLKQIYGLFLGILGMILIILYPVQNSGDVETNYLGFLFILLAVLLTVLYIVGSRLLSKHVTTLQLTFFTIFDSVILYSVLSFFLLIGKSETVLIKLTYLSIAQIVYLSIFGTIVVFYLYQFGIKKTSAFYAGLVNFIQYPVSITAGILFFNEVINLPFIIGSVLIFLGAFFGINRIDQK